MAHTYQGKACLWENKTANPTPLGFLTGHDTSLAYGMNNAGQVQVVGSSNVYTNWDTSRAFLWQNGLMQNLGVLDGWPRSSAMAINDLGVVVGSVGGSSGLQHAAFWYDGVTGYLGEPAGHTASGAGDINNLGDVVGTSGPSSGQAYACWWHRGVATNLHLDAPPEYQSGYSSAYAINNLGQVVGHLYSDPSYGQPFKGRAYIWENHSMQLLPLLDGYAYATAFGINDQGQIVGFAGDGYTVSRAVLWNPVPEPSGLLAFASGLAGLGGVFFSRRRK
jgi:probable HAF family extracellular repeat protein